MPRTGDTIGYARVSTPDQDLSGQRDRLVRNGAVRVFEDVVSGRTFDRPGLAALLDYTRPGDTLAVIRLDRLGRSLRELLETVRTLKAREIDLVSLEEDIDTTSAAGELVFHVFAAIAHFERRLISERTKDGLHAARKRGRTPGRPPLHADTVSALQELVDSGTSVTRAAGYLGIGRSTAYRVHPNKGPKCPTGFLLRLDAGSAPVPGLPDAVWRKLPVEGRAAGPGVQDLRALRLDAALARLDAGTEARMAAPEGRRPAGSMFRRCA